MTTDHCGTLLQASSTPSRSLPSPAPQVGGVRISTCSFQLTETFQTSAEELYRTFLEQEVPEPRTPPPTPLLPHLAPLASSTFHSTFSSFTSSSLSSPSLTPHPFLFHPPLPSSPFAPSSPPLCPFATPVTPPPPLTTLTLPSNPSSLPPPHSVGFFFLLQCNCAKAVMPSLSLCLSLSLSSLCRLSLAQLQ